MAIDYLAAVPLAISDTECYIDYWSIGFRNPVNNKSVIYEKYDGQELDRRAVAQLLKTRRVIGFNWWKYDMPMITLALSGASNALLKEASDWLIAKNPITGQSPMPWDFEARYGVEIRRDLDYIDLFDSSPGVKVSLKKYGARMGTRLLQELPFDPAMSITPEMRITMRWYLNNDLTLTQELFNEMHEEQLLRSTLSAEYKIDLRSKSDAQIAEALFKVEYERITGKKLYKQDKIKAERFHFETPDIIAFESEYLQGVLKHVEETVFSISPVGRIKLPEELEDFVVTIGGREYAMGAGGLHSKEERQWAVSDDDYVIVDRDVKGYYPALMMACGYFPKAIGEMFTPMFKSFIDRRNVAKDLAASYKAAGDKINALKFKIIASSLKIVNNGIFGKTGDPHSVFFGPRLMIQTTLTGQLAILMLIERLVARGFEVLSANTDGIVTKVDRKRRWLFEAIVWDWEYETKLQTEELEYAGIYSQSVNSYFAVPADLKTNHESKVKTKGQFSGAGVHVQDMHDPTCDICSKAVIAYITEGTPIESTIRACGDITQFLRVRMADGGGTKDGQYLGKLVRWYYAEGERGAILTAKGARVATSMGARPCMDLPDEFPDDVDYAWYVREAYARMDDVGMDVQDPATVGRTGYSYAVQPELKTVHILDRSRNTSLCGRKPKEMREPWEEVEHDGKVCKPCSIAAAERSIHINEMEMDL